MNRKHIFSAIMALWAVPAAAGDVKVVKESDLGDRWPLTVLEVKIRCIPIGVGAVVAEAGGTTYALNGIAKGLANEYGFADLESIWRDSPDFERLVEAAAKSEGISVKEARGLMGTPTKVSIAPLLEIGTALCD